MQRLHLQFGLLIGVSLLAASCSEAPKPVIAAAPPPATTSTGTQMCIRLTSIRESRVVSDNVIDFVMNDGSTYRNTLPHSCAGLAQNRAFGYATSLNDLCSVDTISVIIQGGGPVKGAICMLGQFAPYTPAPTATK